MLIIFALLAEFTSFTSLQLSPLQQVFLVISGMAIPLISWLEIEDFSPYFLIIFLMFWLFLEITRKPLENSIKRSAIGPFALVLFALIPALIFPLWKIDPIIALLPFVMVWVTDSMAYFSGKIIQGPKVFPVLSPHKTWAGLVGEIIGGIIVGIGFKLIWPEIFGWDIVIFGFSASLFAVVGDLFESKIKREMHIKDTSHAIPGHGGVWDRLDSWLFVQIWAWIYFVLL